ncbi:MAG: DUF3011 domain-containing protein [Proteobacteria bacterium]|nr:DUF3011 domain-containing protein [Pseudomonadota bacterium]
MLRILLVSALRLADGQRTEQASSDSDRLAPPNKGSECGRAKPSMAVRYLKTTLSRGEQIMRCISMTMTGLALLLVAGQATAGELECRSSGYHYQYCRADTGNNVQLAQKLSSSSCDYGRSWGYDARGIWVDNGCAAMFNYGGRPGSGHHDNTGAIVAGAAAAVILGAIISSNNDRDDRYDRGRHYDNSHNDNPDRYTNDRYDNPESYGNNPGYDNNGVPGWAIGRFSGVDRETGLQIEFAVDRYGRIDGYQGSSEFQGQVRGTSAWIGNRQYELVRARDGFRLASGGNGGYEMTRE